jgi:transcriptional regulator with XRE-family HTH domain
MSDRQIASTSLSARVIEYLRRRGYTQVKIARMLGVSEPFISLVRARERSLTLQHLERLSMELGVPLGALMTAVTEPAKGSKHDKRFFEASARLMKMADKLNEAIFSDIERTAGKRRVSMRRSA